MFWIIFSCGLWQIYELAGYIFLTSALESAKGSRGQSLHPAPLLFLFSFWISAWKNYKKVSTSPSFHTVTIFFGISKSEFVHTILYVLLWNYTQRCVHKIPVLGNLPVFFFEVLYVVCTVGILISSHIKRPSGYQVHHGQNLQNLCLGIKKQWREEILKYYGLCQGKKWPHCSNQLHQN